MFQHAVFCSLDHVECFAAICKATIAYSQEAKYSQFHNLEAPSEWQLGSPLSNYLRRQHLYKILPADQHCKSLTSADMLIEQCQEALKKAGSQDWFDTLLGPPQFGL